MASSGAKFSYLRLRNELAWIDGEGEEERAQSWKAGRWPRLRRFGFRRQLRIQIPGLQRFRRRRSRFFSRVKISWTRAWKRLKNGKAHMNDLFGGNFMVMQVTTPTPFKFGRNFIGHSFHALPKNRAGVRKNA